MHIIIKFLMKLFMLSLIGAAGYFGYTEYFKDERVLIRKTEALLDCFQKDSTESFGSAIDTAELSSLLDDDIFFKVDATDFPFAKFIKEEADKNKVLSFHKTMSGTRYTTVVEKRAINVIKVVPAKDGTVEGEEKAPAKAKVSASFFFRKEEGNHGNIHSDINCDFLFIKKGRSWKVAYILFK